MKGTIILLGILSILIVDASAQNFQGVATYKTKRKLEIQLDSTQINTDMHKRMMDMLQKQFEKTYLLTFNKEASVYKEDKPLEAPQPSDMQIVVMTTGGSDILYKSIKENRFTSQSDVLGKIFLVKDALEKLEWTLTNETKFIGDYTCHKATLKRTVEVVENTISVDGDRDLDTINIEPETKEITITAWYTMQIPVNTGPARYHGLPGLILEINDGEETIVCSKIVINPESKIVIEEPDKGKEINQKEYEHIVEKKAQEQREKYEHRRGDSGGHSIEISIGN